MMAPGRSRDVNSRLLISHLLQSWETASSAERLVRFIACALASKYGLVILME